MVKKQDWSEIQFPSASDRKQKTGFVLVTLILAVGVIGLSVVAFAAHTLKDSDVNSLATKGVVGFNLLYLSTICTLSVLLCLCLGVCAQWFRMIRFNLDVRRAVIGLANCVGVFAAGGLASAGLCPLIIDWMSREQVEIGPVTPNLLILFPAAFAAFGYIVGVIYFPFNLCSKSRNLFYRWFLPVALTIVGFFVVIIGFKLNPRKLFHYTLLSTGVNSETCQQEITQINMHNHIDDPVWLTALVDTCAGGAFLTGKQIFFGVFMLTLVIALFGLVRDCLRTSHCRINA